jgi:hypothetical protein
MIPNIYACVRSLQRQIADALIVACRPQIPRRETHRHSRRPAHGDPGTSLVQHPSTMDTTTKIPYVARSQEARHCIWSCELQPPAEQWAYCASGGRPCTSPGFQLLADDTNVLPGALPYGEGLAQLQSDMLLIEI